MRHVTVSALAVCTMLAHAASAATFYQKAVVDLAPVTAGTAPNDIGTNPSAVAWDGSTAYLAGFNGGATARDTALVNVANVLTAPTFSSRYGVQTSTPSGGRGYVGGDFKAGVGFATAYDNGTNGLVRIDNTAGANVFQITAAGRPLAGPSFDTLSTRLSYLIQGSNTVRNLDVTNGTQTGTVATNINTVTSSTAYRDFDYDAAGNLYARNNNDLVRGNRTDATTYNATATLVANLTDANNIGENLAVIEGFGGASNPLFAIYNDKASNSTGQAFGGVIKATRADGSAESLSFLNADGSAASPLAATTGTGFYDFSYDATTQTLALLDYTNRQLYVFGATASVPEPTTLAALAVAGLVVLRRRAR